MLVEGQRRRSEPIDAYHTADGLFAIHNGLPHAGGRVTAGEWMLSQVRTGLSISPHPGFARLRDARACLAALAADTPESYLALGNVAEGEQPSGSHMWALRDAWKAGKSAL